MLTANTGRLGRQRSRAHHYLRQAAAASVSAARVPNQPSDLAGTLVAHGRRRQPGLEQDVLRRLGAAHLVGQMDALAPVGNHHLPQHPVHRWPLVLLGRLLARGKVVASLDARDLPASQGQRRVRRIRQQYVFRALRPHPLPASWANEST